MRRRTFLGLGIALAATTRAFAAAPSLRIGLTPVFLDDQAGFLERWRSYFEKAMRRPVEFVQRGSYREIIELVRQGKIDVAWVCGYPYVRNRESLRLLAVPLFKGVPRYRSYVIVPAADRTTNSILDLRGGVFAFSDPDSNSGFLYPNYRLITLQERPHAFFGKTFFTWAHRKVVDAVAARVADGGAVDGYVWETLSNFHPELTAQTRVVERSPEFGFPPFVAGLGLPRNIFLEVRRVLMEMPRQPEGRELLKSLNLDGFTPGDDALFAGIEEMAKVFGSDPSAPPA